MNPMTMAKRSTDEQSVSRRRLLTTGAALGVGAAVGVGTDRTVNARQATATSTHGTVTIPFYGKHQAGIETEPAAHATFIAFNLNDDVDKSALIRLMRLVTDSASRLTQGQPALADTEAGLARNPSRLTVTFGFGPGFVAHAKGVAPSWLAPLPAFSIDKLEERWNGGDLLLQVSADDPVSVSHAVRVLTKDVRSFASIHWRQDGFRHSPGTLKPGTTMRNLFGQVDGTVNPEPGSKDFAQVVWANKGWWANGTSLVLRRIAMNLDTWDPVSRVGREEAIGRRLDTGAPLTGTAEHDVPDLDAKDHLGLTVIAEYAHIRRSQTGDAAEVIFRRPYNYDLAPEGVESSASGLLFASYQADVTKQFVPIQRRLDELDMLNEWTTPIGSAVFVIPPGCRKGGYIGETLLEV